MEESKKAEHQEDASGEDLAQFEEYLQNYSTNGNHPLKILLGFYKGKTLRCVRGFFWLLCQRSPVWVLPIVTANIIDTATNPTADGGRKDLAESGDRIAFYCAECVYQLHGGQGIFHSQQRDRRIPAGSTGKEVAASFHPLLQGGTVRAAAVQGHA